VAAQERTTKQVVEDTRVHLSELVDAHKELATAEIKQEISKQVAAVVPLAAAGFIGLYLLGFFAVTGAKALELVVEEWLAWLIVSLALLLIAVVAVLVSRGRMKALAEREGPVGGAKVAADVQDTVEWARTRVTKVGE
jgi:hypothetical protein